MNSMAEIGRSVARNHTPAHLKATLAAFRQAYPSFDTTQLLDDLREREYARLDELDQVYLDYTGGITRRHWQ